MYRAWPLMAWLVFAGSLTVAAAEPAPLDGDGVPLPRGAIARLGSTRWRLRSELREVLLSPDGQTLAVTTSENTTELVDAKTGRRLQSFGVPSWSGMFGPRLPAAFSPDGNVIAYLKASECGQERLLVRRFRDEREHEISFRIKDRYEPKLPEEGQNEYRSQVRGEYITALTFSPDGKVLAAAVHFHLKISAISGEKERILHDEEENVLRRWELSSGKELPACSSHTRTISGIFFSADGKTLTTAGEDGTVRFWDAATGKEKRRRWKADGPLFCAAYSPDGKWFAAGSKKVVLLWDAATEKVRHRLAMPAEVVWSLAFTPDSKRLVAGGGTALRLWETETGKQVGEATALANAVLSLVFSADGKQLFLGHETEQIVRRPDAGTLKPVGELNGHARPVPCLAFTADNQRLLTAAEDDFRCWDARTGKPCSRDTTDKKLVERALLATLEERWSLHSRQVEYRTVGIVITPSEGKEISGSDPAWSADGRRVLLRQNEDKLTTFVVLDRQSCKKLRELPNKDENTSAGLSPDGRILAIGEAKHLTFLEVDSGRFRQYDFAVGAGLPLPRCAPLTFSPDGARIAFPGEKGKVQIVSVLDGQLRGTIVSEVADRIIDLTFSTDGKTLCLQRFDEPRTLWEVASGQMAHSFLGRGCLLSPGNRFLIIPSEKALDVHELYSGKKFRTCRDAAGFAGPFRFSSDDKRLATASKDTTVLLWDMATPEEVQKSTPLDEKTLERLWSELRTGKAAEAYPAMGRLIADPEHTLAFLRKHLRKLPPVEEKRLRQWIADLDSDAFDRRETASRELGRLGRVAESALRKSLARPTSPEMRRRIKELLRPFETPLSPEELADTRAIQILESIGTPEARAILKDVAEGAAGVPRTRDAREALNRMQQRRE